MSSTSSARLRHTSSTAGITPFWDRIPAFFLFPFKTDSLLRLVPITLLGLLAFVLPLPQQVGFVISQVLVLLAFTRLGFRSMDYTARGLLDPEQYAFAPQDETRAHLPWKLAALFVVNGTFVGLLGAANSALGTVALIWFNVSLPAMIMVLNQENSFFEALNPARGWDLMRRVGWAYGALCLFLLLLSTGLPMFLPFLTRLSSQVAGWLLYLFLMGYFSLIMFNMMGYALYQYHEALGGSLDLQATRGHGAAPARDLIAECVDAGDIEAALDIAYEDQRVAGDDVAVQGRYHQLLLLAGKASRATDHGQRYISLLLRKDRGGEALKVYATLQSLDAAFRLEDGNQVLALAQTAWRRREPDTVLNLLKRFDQNYVRHAAIPDVYLLSARLMSEHYRQHETAAQILRTLCARYPNHQRVSEAHAYLTSLRPLLTPGARPPLADPHH